MLLRSEKMWTTTDYCFCTRKQIKLFSILCFLKMLKQNARFILIFYKYFEKNRNKRFSIRHFLIFFSVGFWTVWGEIINSLIETVCYSYSMSWWEWYSRTLWEYHSVILIFWIFILEINRFSHDIFYWKYGKI